MREIKEKELKDILERHTHWLNTVYISGNKYSLLDDPEWTERKSSEWCRIIEEAEENPCREQTGTL